MRIIFHIIVAIACIISLTILFGRAVDKEFAHPPAEKNVEIPEQH